MKLVKIGDRIFNLAQLIDADFASAASGFDDEFQQGFSREAQLSLYFAVSDSEARTDYDGDVIGESFAPFKRVLRGAEAEGLWEYMVACCN